MATFHRKSAQCSRCGSRLRVEIDTDGAGLVVDLVDPCPRCAPQSRIIVKPRAGLLQPARGRSMGPRIETCPGCQQAFSQDRTVGRPRKYCTACRPERQRDR